MGMENVKKGIEVEKIERFSDALQGMMLKMQEIDNRCMESAKDITKREFVLVILIGRNGEMIMREIADYLQIPMSTATGIVDKLVEKDYLLRNYSAEDRRIVKVDLSKAGKEVYKLMSESMFVFCEATLCKFSEDDQEKFINCLTTVSK